MDQSLKKFIEAMPKVELHLHIEGSFEPELVFEIAHRNNMPLLKKDGTEYQSAEEFSQASQAIIDSGYKDLQDFLNLYYQRMNVLQTEQDFYDLTMAYLRKVKSQNVTHTEIFFDPQEHVDRGVPFATVINGIYRALKDAERDMGISSKLIMSFVRHKSEEEAFEILAEAQPHMDKIDGFGLDSSEKPFPPHMFERVFAKARKTGKMVLAHAGEEGPPEYVTQALDLLKVNRIDHGNRSLEDPALTQRLADSKMGLTVCPLSNLKLGGIKDMNDHPMKIMLDKGLKASCNSDDPAYFGGYMNENFIALADALHLTRSDIVRLARNAIETSFMSPEQKREKTHELDDYIARFEAAEKFVNPEVGKLRRYA